VLVHAQPPIASPVPFVQSFYDWYSAHQTSFETAIKQKPSAFAPTLLAALRADLAASARDKDDVVGLDFDPLTASQDPCQHYAAGAPTHAGAIYQVPIYGICDGERHPEPDLIAELTLANGTWTFTNFVYPAHDTVARDSLTNILATLAKSRQAR
jgi:hypothetical protein